MQKFHQQSLTFIIEKKTDAYIGRIEEMPDLTPVVGSNINLVRYQLCLRLAHATHLWPENSEIGSDQGVENMKPQAPQSKYQAAS
jgi:hypothetical protein